VKLVTKRQESSKHNYYIISPRLMIKAIIIVMHWCPAHLFQSACSTHCQKNTFMFTNTRMHTHTCAHEYTCAFMTSPKHDTERLLRLIIYAQICIHMHINIYIHAYAYLYLYTCIYIHIYMFIRTHTYTYIHTHTQHVHMHAHKHAWNHGAAATACEARLDATKAPHSP